MPGVTMRLGELKVYGYTYHSDEIWNEESDWR